MFDEAGALDHFYFQTKHESEGIVRAEKRLNWRIYRPGVVVGHSRTGEMNKIDSPYYFFETLYNLNAMVLEGMPLLMNKAGLLNIVPVDYVVKAMDYLAHLPGHDLECFYQTDPNGIRVSDALKTLVRVSHGPRLHARDALPVDAATRLAGKGIGRMPLVKMLGELLLKRMGIPPQVVAYINYPTRFNSTRTRALLEPVGIIFPPFEG